MIDRKNVLNAGLCWVGARAEPRSWISRNGSSAAGGAKCLRRRKTVKSGQNVAVVAGRPTALSLPLYLHHQVKPDLTFPARAAVPCVNMKPAHLHLATRALLHAHGELLTHLNFSFARISFVIPFFEVRRILSLYQTVVHGFCFCWLTCRPMQAFKMTAV